MTKQELIFFLENHAKKAGLFGGRFCRTIDDSDDYWSYNRPAIDCLEATIDLTIDGYVTYFEPPSFGGSKTLLISYEEFIKKYFICFTM